MFMANTIYKALQAGRFYSRGKGRHIVRCLADWELIFVVSGSLDMFAGDQKFHLVAGDRLLLAAGIEHGGLNNYQPDLSFFWLHFMPQNRAAANFIKSLPPQDVVADKLRLTEYLQLYLSIQSSSPEDQTARDIVMQLILHEITKTSQANVTEQHNIPLPARLVREARRIIQLKYYTKITTSTIAAELYCNADYLGRLYRASYNTTITDDIHAMRMKLTGKLLLTTQLSIKEIANRAGFDDLAHFRKIFFRTFAMTPKQYRSIYAAGYANSE